MSHEQCYYGIHNFCAGALWYCRTCEEWYCETHTHTTDKGVNIECVSCEQTRSNDVEEETSDRPVTFNFGVDNTVSILALEGTDPDTLLDQAHSKFVEMFSASGGIDITLIDIDEGEWDEVERNFEVPHTSPHRQDLDKLLGRGAIISGGMFFVVVRVTRGEYERLIEAGVELNEHK